jgi:hypothetical protein
LSISAIAFLSFIKIFQDISRYAFQNVQMAWPGAWWPGGLVAWSNREESSHQGWQRGGGVGQAQHRTGAMAMAADGAGMGWDVTGKHGSNSHQKHCRNMVET